MYKREGLWLWIVILVAAALLPIGCSKKKAPAAQPAAPTAVTPSQEEAAPERPESPVTGEAAGGGEEAPARIVFRDAFFDFDKFNLRPDAIEALSYDAKLLSEHPEIRIVIEGHCDERGTIEYNLALGEKRARAAKDFLVRYGIEPDRIEIISYGEEKPFALGHNEAAWAKNRRAHFVIKQN